MSERGSTSSCRRAPSALSSEYSSEFTSFFT
jgi:hypothetical protein